MKWGIKKMIISAKKVLKIKDHPEKIARGFALGSFIGMLPVPGFQVLIALGASALIKVNRKAACLAVFNTNVATGAFVFAFNYWLGHLLLGFSSSFTMPDKLDRHFILILLNAGSEVFLSLLLGGVISGVLCAVIVYYGVKYLLVQVS